MTEQMNVPKLRFDEFDGEWQKLTLKQVSTKNISYGVVQTGDKDLIVPCVRVVDLTSGSLNRDAFIKTSEAINQSYKKTILESGELMVALRGVIGLTRAVPVDLVGCNLTRGIARISPDQKRFSSQFIEQALNTPKSSQRFDQLKNGSALKEISIGELNKYSTDYPYLPEQQKIASFLSKVDEKIALLTEKQDKLTEYKKGVMQQLFNCKWKEQDGQLIFIPPTLRFKADDGSDFPDWEEKKLGDVGSIVSGLTYSPEHVVEHGTLVLRSSNIQNGQLSFQDNVYVNTDKFNSVIEGDILICVRNGSKNLIGKNALITAQAEGMAFGAFMTVYRSKYAPYLQHYFKTDTYKRNVHRNLGATINSINGSDLKKFKVSMPSQAEQSKIATLLNSLDIKINHTISELEKAKEWKKGLLQQMFV